MLSPGGKHTAPSGCSQQSPNLCFGNEDRTQPGWNKRMDHQCAHDVEFLVEILLRRGSLWRWLQIALIARCQARG